MRYLIAIAILATSSCSSPNQAVQTENATVPPPAEPKIDKCKIPLPQLGRGEKNYKDMSGYLGFTSRYDMPTDKDEIQTTPWEIPTLIQSGPDKWDNSGKSVHAKIKATVIEQQLKDQGFGNYDGALTVKLEDGSTALIAPKYFIPTDWWNCHISDAINYSPVVAEVQPGAKPLDADGRWANISSVKQVLCTNDGPPGLLTGQDLIACKTYTSGRLFFDPKSLKLVY
jgi:hypothetical protein